MTRNASKLELSDSAAGEEEPVSLDLSEHFVREFNVVVHATRSRIVSSEVQLGELEASYPLHSHSLSPRDCERIPSVDGRIKNIPRSIPCRGIIVRARLVSITVLRV